MNYTSGSGYPFVQWKITLRYMIKKELDTLQIYKYKTEFVPYTFRLEADILTMRKHFTFIAFYSRILPGRVVPNPNPKLLLRINPKHNPKTPKKFREHETRLEPEHDCNPKY